MKKIVLKSLVLATVGMMCLAGSASALPILRITDGVETITRTDNDENGLRLLNQTIGDWTISTNTGLTDPAIGSSLLPELNLASTATSNGNASTLTIIWLDNTLGPVSSSVQNFVTSVGGGYTDGEVTVQSFYSDEVVGINNVGTMTALSDPLTFTGSAFSGSDVSANLLGDANPVTLALVATITHSGAATSELTSFTANMNVPEPGALLAFGTGMMGLVGIAAVRRREDQE